jgi:hypothetical protein
VVGTREVMGFESRGGRDVYISAILRYQKRFENKMKMNGFIMLTYCL